MPAPQIAGLFLRTYTVPDHSKLLRNATMLSLYRTGRYSMRSLGVKFKISKFRVSEILKAQRSREAKARSAPNL
jgi:hypothetical protein